MNEAEKKEAMVFVNAMKTTVECLEDLMKLLKEACNSLNKKIKEMESCL